MAQTHQFDVLIIGSGAAGLGAALQLADYCKVAVISKGQLSDGCTIHAQGGVSSVLDEADTFAAHIEDTINAGAGLCDPEIVQLVVEQGPAAIKWLTDLGVPLTKHPDSSSKLHLTREGGHSHRRVVHAADATGRAIETNLAEATRQNKNIQIFEQHIAVDLITGAKLDMIPNRCLGAYVLDRAKGHVAVFKARYVILATGGASKVYVYTSNPDTSTGDGIAMAWRAGCRVSNMEFNQFHPTCLFHPKAKSFLLTEALRGEGGKLRLPDGSAFLHKFDERGELAPRDIVARAIDHEMKRLGASSLFLDISHKPAAFIKSHFPTVYARCLEFGFDITKQAIPVVPAAHYTCGGIVTDRAGQTDLQGLYAIGETACTGLHGANRMASNSLLECLVFARFASKDIIASLKQVTRQYSVPDWDESQVTDSDEEVVVSHNWDELRRFMWDYVGIVRTDKRLQRARRRVQLLQKEIHDYYSNFRVTNDLLELRNLVQVADLIIRSAQQRKESRGLHYTLDYPAQDDSHPPAETILTPDQTVTDVVSASSMR